MNNQNNKILQNHHIINKNHHKTRFENEVRSWCKSRTNLKWSNGVKLNDIGIFWCMSVTKNVESFKIFKKAQKANFSVLARERWPRKGLFAKNMEN